MNNFWAYFVFILGLAIMITILASPTGHWGLIGIILVVWGLHSLIGNAKKEVTEELKKK